MYVGTLFAHLSTIYSSREKVENIVFRIFPDSTDYYTHRNLKQCTDKVTYTLMIHAFCNTEDEMLNVMGKMRFDLYELSMYGITASSDNERGCLDTVRVNIPFHKVKEY